MKCMHCQVEFHDNLDFAYIGTDSDQVWLVETNKCAGCGRYNLVLVNSEGESVEHTPINEKNRYPIHPRVMQRPTCHPNVPGDIAQDYIEARLALDYSPRASAALARSALQKLIRNGAGIIPGELAEEMLDLLDSHQLPHHLADLVKGTIIISNFYSNPFKSQNPQAILPVVTAEAELLLEVLEALFDFYYVQPAISAGRWVALKTKLFSEGKPLLK